MQGLPHTLDQVKSRSVLWPMREIPPEVIEDIKWSCHDAVALVASRMLESRSVTVRDLQGDDLQFKDGSAAVINDMSQTSGGSDNTWATMVVQAGTDLMDVTIPSDRAVGIYGMGIQSVAASGLGPVVSGVRFHTGQSLIQQINLYPLWTVSNPDATESALITPQYGYLEQPIIMSPSTPLKIEDYTLEISENYNLIFLGWTAHKPEHGPSPQESDFPFSSEFLKEVRGQ